MVTVDLFMEIFCLNVKRTFLITTLLLCSLSSPFIVNIPEKCLSLAWTPAVP